MNECLTTPQYKNKSAIGYQTNGIYIKGSHFNETRQYNIKCFDKYIILKSTQIKATETNK